MKLEEYLEMLAQKDTLLLTTIDKTNTSINQLESTATNGDNSSTKEKQDRHKSFGSSLTNEGIYLTFLEKDDHAFLGSSPSNEDISFTTKEQDHHKSFGSSLTDEGVHPTILEKDDHELLVSSLSVEDISSTTTEQDRHGSFGSSLTNKDFQSTTEKQYYSPANNRDNWYDKIISLFRSNILMIAIVVGICSVIMILLMSLNKSLNKKQQGSRLKLVV